MDKLIIYCHGYASSANSDKLDALQKAGFDAHCFQADIDPEVAFQSISDRVDDLLMDRMNEEIKLIFVGTSLGGWMASKLADSYGADAVIINPSLDPEASLVKYGVPKEIRNKYEKMKVNSKYQYFFAQYDEVIDHTECIKQCTDIGASITIVQSAYHRFQKDFSRVIKFLTKAK